MTYPSTRARTITLRSVASTGADQGAPKVAYQFAIYGTGQTLPSDFDHNRKGNRFLGTIQQGPYVWHVFLAED